VPRGTLGTLAAGAVLLLSSRLAALRFRLRVWPPIPLTDGSEQHLLAFPPHSDTLMFAPWPDGHFSLLIVPGEGTITKSNLTILYSRALPMGGGQGTMRTS
jgi:hypothetical protein